MYKKIKIVLIIILVILMSLFVHRNLNKNAGVPDIDIEVYSQNESDKYIKVYIETTPGKCVEASNITDIVITYNIGEIKEEIIIEEEYDKWIVCGEREALNIHDYEIPSEASNIQIRANYFGEPIYSSVERVTNDKIIIENAEILEISDTSIQFEITLKNISDIVIPIDIIYGIQILEHGKHYTKNNDHFRLAYYPEGKTNGYIYPPRLTPINSNDIDPADSLKAINPGESYTFTSSVLISDLEKAEINYENGLDFVYYEPNTETYYTYELDSNK